MLDNDSVVYLLKDVDLDADSEHTIDFDNAEQQQNYFNSKIDRTLLNTDENADFTYIREQQAIAVPFNIDALFGVNYLMYNNDNKWYYAYIIRKEFVSVETTKLHIKLDIYQTFMFDFELDECFVEREHQDRWDADKNPIFNLEDEQLEKGDTFITKQVYELEHNAYIGDNTDYDEKYGDLIPDCVWISVVASENIIYDESEITAQPTTFRDVPTNIYYYVAPVYLADLTGEGITNITNYVLGQEAVNTTPNIARIGGSKMINELSKDSRIISITMSKYCPFYYKYNKVGDNYHLELYNNKYSTARSSGVHSGRYKTPEKVFNFGLFKINYKFNNRIEYPLLIDATTNPAIELVLFDELKYNVDLDINIFKNINNEPKLLTSKYHYYSIYNKNKTLYHEYFKGKVAFNLIDACSVKNTKMLVPLNYKNENVAYTDALIDDDTLNELPLRTSAWLNYLLNNKASMVSGMKTSAIQTGINVVSGLASGNPLGIFAGISQGVNYGMQVANKMAQIKDLKNTPAQVKEGSNDIIINTIINNSKYKIVELEIEESFKRKIFNYLYHYGYKCNDFKKPNVRSRYYFNYIKTIDANIKSNISNEYISELKALFEKGITIWHYRDAETFKGIRNYAYENVEMALMPANE